MPLTPEQLDQKKTQFADQFDKISSVCKMKLVGDVVVLVNALMRGVPAIQGLTLEDRVAAINTRPELVLMVVMFSVIKAAINTHMPNTFDADLGVGKDGVTLTVQNGQVVIVPGGE